MRLALRALGAFAFALAACAPRLPSTPDAAPQPASIELRAAHGELRMSLTPADPGWTVEIPGRPPLTARLTASGATVTDHSGAVVAELRPAPITDYQLLDGTGAIDRVTFPAPRWIDVFDPNGVTLVRAEPSPEGALGHDAAGSPALVARVESDRIVLHGLGDVVLGTVHQTRNPVVAVVLGSDMIPLPARAALTVYLLAH